MPKSYAFVTLLSSDSYLPGALVIPASLRELHSSLSTDPELEFKTVCLVTPDSVEEKSITALRKAFDVVVGVEILESPSQEQGLALLGRPDLATVLTKLHVFRLTEYDKIIFLDADVLPVQPLSHLFLTDAEFSACPDVGWPDIFNSGFMVLEPGHEKFEQLTNLVQTRGSWDGGDQGILNEWRGSNWNRLSFTYNTTPTAAYTYAPAYKRFGANIRAIHFIGPNKPWASIPWRAPIEHPSIESQQSYGYSALVDRWYAVYDRNYRPAVVATEEEFNRSQFEPVWGIEARTVTATAGSLEVEPVNQQVPHTFGNMPLTRKKEAEYRTMPLNGNVELVRRRPVTTTSAIDGRPHISVQDSGGPGHLPFPNGELRPPGREGLPSYLYRPPPPNTSTSHYYQDQPWRGSDDQPLQATETIHDHQHSTSDPPEAHFVAPAAQHGHSSDPSRPQSPPLILWDPAVEPPPHNQIAAMSFIGDSHYENVWDLPPSFLAPRTSDPRPVWDHRAPSPFDHSTFEASQSEPYYYPQAPRTETKQHKHPQNRPEDFFYSSQQPSIPEHLVRDGQYAAVILNDPRPDVKKVEPIFPWEQRDRPRASRKFPEWEPKPPALQLPDVVPVPSQPARAQPSPTQHRKRSLSPPTNVTRRFNPHPEPPRRYGATYLNAWDQDTGIQRYASALQGRPKGSSYVQVAQAASGSKPNDDSEFTNWADRAEASSRDGDDEDDLEGSPLLSPRSRARGSKGKGNLYRNQAVQTEPKKTESRAIQVSVPTEKRFATNLQAIEAWKEETVYSELPKLRNGKLLDSIRDFPGSEPFPLLGDIQETEQSPLAAPPVRQRELSGDTVTTAQESSVLSSPGTETEVDFHPRIQDAVDSTPTYAPRRRVGRVFDPTTGLDIFKKSSEEVLQRFLRQGGAWQAKEPSPQNPGTPTFSP